MIRYNGKDIVPMYNGRELKRVLCRGQIIWERVFGEDYTLKCGTYYPANPYKCTINGNTYSYEENVEVDVSEFAPIITFKLTGLNSISKLPYLGDCEELIIDTGNQAYSMGIPDINTKKCKTINIKYISPSGIKGIDFDSVTSLSLVWEDYGDALPPYSYLTIRNLGKSSLDTYGFTGAANWSSSNSRQTLIDSLITNSYDRAANGMPSATINLNSNVVNDLTDIEIAEITAKGFTLVKDY